MELNAEMIKKALECCVSLGGCQKCSYRERGSVTCMYDLRSDALALINSQEQRIKELTEERKDFEIRALRAENEATKYKDCYEIEKQAREQLSESYDYLEKTKDELLSERSRLIEKCQEAEKINKEKCNLEYTLLGVMNSVDKWLDGDELEQDEVNRAITMREKTLQIVEKLTEENERLRAIPEQLHKEMSERMVEEVKTTKKYTVLIMQSEIKKTFSAICKGEMVDLYRIIDQVAKEMLEGL